ncbi:hypothetical protein G5714_024578 [Onychostoma macrolepis]|uniref:Uncharacterized protein n=1 Tax=Onychostoma macrolepis TaxID=369639 RepID=A0A7J6BHP6_9TELE|nr:hypothetical protein G5714_024578 [Onychostoma macrolepis]
MSVGIGRLNPAFGSSRSASSAYQKSDDRFARQDRCGPPPEFPLASPCPGIVHHLSGTIAHALAPPARRCGRDGPVVRPPPGRGDPTWTGERRPSPSLRRGGSRTPFDSRLATRRLRATFARPFLAKPSRSRAPPRKKCADGGRANGRAAVPTGDPRAPTGPTGPAGLNPPADRADPTRLPLNGFTPLELSLQSSFQLSSRYLSTIGLVRYLALDGVYHPLWAAFPSNPTPRRTALGGAGPPPPHTVHGLSLHQKDLGPGPRRERSSVRHISLARGRAGIPPGPASAGLHLHCAVGARGHPLTRACVRLLGPCFKTGRSAPVDAHTGSEGPRPSPVGRREGARTLPTTPGVSGKVGAWGLCKARDPEAASHLRPPTLPGQTGAGRGAPPRKKCADGGRANGRAAVPTGDPRAPTGPTGPAGLNPPADRADPTRLPLNGFTPLELSLQSSFQLSLTRVVSPDLRSHSRGRGGRPLSPEGREAGLSRVGRRRAQRTPPETPRTLPLTNDGVRPSARELGVETPGPRRTERTCRRRPPRPPEGTRETEGALPPKRRPPTDESWRSPSRGQRRGFRPTGSHEGGPPVLEPQTRRRPPLPVGEGETVEGARGGRAEADPGGLHLGGRRRSKAPTKFPAAGTRRPRSIGKRPVGVAPEEPGPQCAQVSMINVSCTTLVLAASCVLHRRTSRVIHR